MHRLFTGIIGFALLAASGRLQADPDVPTLPKDGTWIRYFGRSWREGEGNESTSKRTYSLVGTTTEKGQLCRWVEMSEAALVDGNERTDIIKFLLPEKELRTNDAPLESLIRCWRKIDNEPVRELKFNSQEGFSGGPHFYWGRDFVIFPGSQRDSQVVRESKTVEYQSGRLEIPMGYRAQFSATRRARTADISYSQAIEFVVWRHSDLPLGVAAWNGRLELRQDDLV
ncbi:MAG: hypothetical protein ACKV0T_10770, partial [Planctomycetales bacterium]